MTEQANSESRYNALLLWLTIAFDGPGDIWNNRRLAMQIETNEIRMIHNKKALLEALDEGFGVLPNELQEAATRKLNGKASAFVSKTSGGKLSKFAASRRKARKAANRSRRLGEKKKIKTGLVPYAIEGA